MEGRECGRGGRGGAPIEEENREMAVERREEDTPSSPLSRLPEGAREWDIFIMP